MSKHKDVDKVADKPIEKIKPEKELAKIEKHEPKEFKEPIKEKVEHKEFKEGKEIKEGKPEKLEHKEKPEKHEHKEKPEKIEHKEKAEHKEKIEIKEHPEKQVPEKGGKELVEGINPGEIFEAHGGGIEAAKAAPIKHREIEKIKAEKEHVEKIKPEKEHLKNELKDLKHEKIEFKEHKIEKFEHKEKVEIKELAKIEIKEHNKELEVKDISNEGPGKGIAEGPIDPGIKVFEGTGTPEERLSRIEDALTRVSHFIGVDLRPDLSAGALKDEADVSADKPGAPPKPEIKPNKPGR